MVLDVRGICGSIKIDQQTDKQMMIDHISWGWWQYRTLFTTETKWRKIAHFISFSWHHPFAMSAEQQHYRIIFGHALETFHYYNSNHENVLNFSKQMLCVVRAFKCILLFVTWMFTLLKYLNGPNELIKW